MRHLPLAIALVLAGGCSQSRQIVPIVDSPSYMLTVERVRLTGDLGASALPGEQLRLDLEVEGADVVALVSVPWRVPVVYRGAADASPLSLSPEGDVGTQLSARDPSGAEHTLQIDSIVLDGFVSEEGIRWSGEAEIEGTETAVMSATSSRGYPEPPVTARARATLSARPDDVAPEARLAVPATMVGVLPWEAGQINLSEPVLPESARGSVSGADALAIEVDEVRGQAYRGRVLPAGWWTADQTLSPASSLVDPSGNDGLAPAATIDRVEPQAPAPAFDFESDDTGVHFATAGESFLSTRLGCAGGAQCLAFRHPEFGGRSELYARLAASSFRTIRARIRVLAEESMWGGDFGVMSVQVRAAPEGSTAEVRASTTLSPMRMAEPFEGFVSDTGWQTIEVTFDGDVSDAGFFISFDSSDTYGYAASAFIAGGDSDERPAAGAAAPPPIPAMTVLIDDIEAI